MEEDNFNNNLSISSPKNFMSPTVSATSKSKSFSAKNKILAESNSSKSKSFSTRKKILVESNSKSSSYKMGVINSDDKENTFISDSSSASDKPYDPLTNYLSPRPRFLRYNPNRYRGIELGKEGNNESNIDPKVSAEFQGSSTAESSLVAENECIEDHAVVEKEDVEEDEEEVFEGQKAGFKWELLKFVVVFVVLVVSSMYISSMNSTRSGILFDYPKFDNVSSEVVLLRGSEFGDRLFVGREESNIGIFENVRKDHLIESAEISELGKVEEEATFIDLIESEPQMSVSDMTEMAHSEPKIEDGKPENEPEMVASDMTENADSEPKMEDGQSEHESEMVASDMTEIADSEPKIEDEQSENESEMVASDMTEIADSDPKMEDGQSENESEMVASDTTEMADSEPNIEDGQSENEPEIVTEESDEKIRYESDTPAIDLIENEQNQLLKTPKNMAWVLLSSVLVTLVTSLSVRFYFKYNKASSKRNPSNVKPCTQLELEPDQKNDSRSISPPVTPPKEERLEKTPPRRIPKVKVLSEFEIEGNFTRSLNKCSIQENEEIHSLERRVLRIKDIKANFKSNGDYISHENTTNEEEKMSKETPTPLRRSNRLRGRGITSP